MVYEGAPIFGACGTSSKAAEVNNEEGDPFAEYLREEAARTARINRPPIPLFGAGQGRDLRLQAWVQGFFSDDSTEAHGYRDAAKSLVEAVRNGEALADLMVFPIVFCYRHYVELILKSILRSAVAAELMTRDEFASIAREHNLSKLWRFARRTIVACDSKEANKPFLRRVGHRIAELHRYDPESYSYRYRTSVKGEERRLPNDLPHLDIGSFCEGMDDVAFYLDMWWDEMDRVVDFHHEMRALYADEY